MWRQLSFVVCVFALLIGCAGSERGASVADAGHAKTCPVGPSAGPLAVQPLRVSTDASGQLAEPGSTPQIMVDFCLLRVHGAEEKAFRQALQEEAGITFAPEHLSAETRSRAILGTSLAATTDRDGVFKAVKHATTFKYSLLVNAPRLVVNNGHEASVTIGNEVPVLLPGQEDAVPKHFMYLQEGRDIHVTPILAPDRQSIAMVLSVRDNTLEQLKPSVIEFGANARVLAHVPIDGALVIRTPFIWHALHARQMTGPGGQPGPTLRAVRKATKPLHDKKQWLYLIARTTVIEKAPGQTASMSSAE